MGQSRPLFVYFCHFFITISIIEKSIDGMLGIRTLGRRMVGADETTELWHPPHCEKCIPNKIHISSNSTKTHFPHPTPIWMFRRIKEFEPWLWSIALTSKILVSGCTKIAWEQQREPIVSYLMPEARGCYPHPHRCVY